MEVIYRRNLYKSYMCIKEPELKPEKFEIKILENRKIPRLLPVQTIITNGTQDYLYEISGKQQLEDFILGKKMNYEILRKLLISLQELCDILSEYLLRESGVCLELEFIYVNLEDNSFYFTYLPFWEKNLSEAFEYCMEQILRKIDHQDQAATELGYQVYQMCTKKNASLRKILEDALKIIEHTLIDKKQEKIELDFTQEGCIIYKEEELFKKDENIKDKKIINNIKNKEKCIKEKAQKNRNSEFEMFEIDKEHTKEKIWKKIKMLDWLQEKGYFSLQFFRRVFEKRVCNKNSVFNQSIGYEKKLEETIYFPQNRFFKKKEKKKKEKLEEVFKKNYQVKNARNKKENNIEKKSNKGNKAEQKWKEKEENRTEKEGIGREEKKTVYPTEILGVNSQLIMGKLIYQGIHNCTDILIERDEFLLGKNRQQVHGVIEAEGISRLHARITKQGNTYYIEDLNSTNGTYLNEIPLEYHQKKELYKNDLIRFGREEYVFS